MILYEASNPAHLRPIEDALLPGVDLGKYMNPPASIKIGSNIKARDGMDLCIKCFNYNKPTEVAIRSLAYHAKHESGHFSITKFWESLCWHAQHLGGPYMALLQTVISMGRFAVMRNPLGSDLMGADASRNIQNLVKFIPNDVVKQFGGDDGAHEAAVRFSREVGARLIKRKANYANFREGVNAFIAAVKLISNPVTVTPNRPDNPNGIGFPEAPKPGSQPAPAKKESIQEGLFGYSAKQIAYRLLTNPTVKTKKLTGYYDGSYLEEFFKTFSRDLLANTKIFSKTDYDDRLVLSKKSIKALNLPGDPLGVIYFKIDSIKIEYSQGAYSGGINALLFYVYQNRTRQTHKLYFPSSKFRDEILKQAFNAKIIPNTPVSKSPPEDTISDDERDFAFVSDENSAAAGYTPPSGDELNSLIKAMAQNVSKPNGLFRRTRESIEEILNSDNLFEADDIKPTTPARPKGAPGLILIKPVMNKKDFESWGEKLVTAAHKEGCGLFNYLVANDKTYHILKFAKNGTFNAPTTYTKSVPAVNGSACSVQISNGGSSARIRNWPPQIDLPDPRSIPAYIAELNRILPVNRPAKKTEAVEPAKPSVKPPVTPKPPVDNKPIDIAPGDEKKRLELSQALAAFPKPDQKVISPLLSAILNAGYGISKATNLSTKNQRNSQNKNATSIVVKASAKIGNSIVIYFEHSTCRSTYRGPLGARVNIPAPNTGNAVRTAEAIKNFLNGVQPPRKPATKKPIGGEG